VSGTFKKILISALSPLETRHSSPRRALHAPPLHSLPRAAEPLDSERTPLWRRPAGGDDRRMAGGDADAKAASGLVLADALRQAQPDAEPLIVRGEKGTGPYMIVRDICLTPPTTTCCVLFRGSLWRSFYVRSFAYPSRRGSNAEKRSEGPPFRAVLERPAPLEKTVREANDHNR
jgi:hypothetical protein